MGKICRIDIPILIALLVIAAFLRFNNLETNPGWDLDEGYNISIAQNLMAGQGQMLAVRQVFIQHPPLYYALVAIGLLFNSADPLLTLRVVSAILAVLAIVPVYLVARHLGGIRAATFAGFLYAASYLVVSNSRFGYSYSLMLLLLPLLVLAIFALESKPSRGRVVLLGAVMAALLLSERLAIPAVILAFAWVLWRRGWREGLGVGAIAIAPTLGYLGVFLVSQPDILLFDILHTGGRVGGGPSSHMIGVLVTYLGFIKLDLLITMGFVGLFLALNRNGGMRVLLIGICTILLSVLLRDPRAYFRQALPTVALLSVGCGVVLDYCLVLIWQRTKKTLPFTILGLLLLVPFGIDTMQTVAGMSTGFNRGELAKILAEPVAGYKAAEAINRLAGEDDLVIVNSHISWLVKARVADWAQSAATSGEAVAFYPANMDKHFVYDARLDSAKVAVVDDFLRAWVEEEPASVVAKMYREVTGNWQLVATAGQFAVYTRP